MMDGKIKFEHQSSIEIRSWQGVGNRIVDSRDMEDKEIMRTVGEQVDSFMKEDIVGVKSAEGWKEVDSIEIVSVNEETSRRIWKMWACVAKGAKNAQSFKVKD